MEQVMIKRAAKSFAFSTLVALLIIVGSDTANAGNLWDGGGVNANWTTTANWDNDTLPDFTTLTFDGALGLANTNDNVGLAVTGPINFATTAGAFVIGGNGITFGTTVAGSANITNSSTNLQTINLDLAISSI